MLRTANYQQISPQAIKSLKTPQEIREAISGAKDYRVMDNQLECGGVVSGDEYKAEKQKHRLDMVNLEGFNLLSREEQNALIAETLDEIQNSIKNATVTTPSAFSCMLMNILLPGKEEGYSELLTANLGDCSAYTVRRDKSSEEVTVAAIGKTHPPIYLSKYRTTITSGGIGGLEFVDSGLSHKPVFSRQQIPTTSDECDYYVLASDKEVDTRLLTRNLTRYFADGMNLDAIAHELAVDLTQHNSSFMITRLNNRKASLSSAPVVAACIFKGVHYDVYAEWLRVLFLPKLLANIQAQLEQLSTQNYTLANYLTLVRSAMMQSDSMVDYLRELKLADKVLRNIFPNIGDYDSFDKSAFTLFAPTCKNQESAEAIEQHALLVRRGDRCLC